VNHVAGELKFSCHQEYTLARVVVVEVAGHAPLPL
jgi:hypothetical protein